MKKETHGIDLKSSNLIVTPQRVAVLEALNNLKNHPTADKIKEYVVKNHPNIAVGTIYKTLETFVEKGLVKKVKLEAFSNVRRSGLIAIKIKGEDKLIWAKPTSGKDEIQLITAGGQAIRFKESDVRDMGRSAELRVDCDSVRACDQYAAFR